MAKDEVCEGAGIAECANSSETGDSTIGSGSYCSGVEGWEYSTGEGVESRMEPGGGDHCW